MVNDLWPIGCGKEYIRNLYAEDCVTNDPIDTTTEYSFDEGTPDGCYCEACLEGNIDMWDDAEETSDEIPNRVWVALEILNSERSAEQITSLAFDVIANYLKEDSNV